MTWPVLWNNTGTLQEFTANKEFRDKANHELENFFVMVNEKEGFNSNLPKLKITNKQDKFTTLDNPYFVACCAAYCTTYLCGISTKQFNDPISKLISSI